MYQFHFEPLDTNILKVSITGLPSADDIVATLKAVGDKATESQLHKVLFDITQVSIELEVSQLVGLLKNGFGFLRPLVFAAVGNVGDFKHDLLNQIANNQGVKTQFFETEQDAFKWLSEQA